MVWSRKIRREDLPDDWSTWVYARFQSQEARDGFVDSVALVHDQKIVTRNLRHFERISGLRVEGY